ncbi:MAG: alpha/beta fold hydrolase [Rhizobiales bacterium]|nr:alpha/beta fold hydrolase [Hyphomicrobiales bacterium]
MGSTSTQMSFAGWNGAKLSARLELPSEPPRAVALFAHCFTCSKDVFAATRIARGLADRAIAVLRFDFTGLGESEGEFAGTHFSSNVEDVVRAADHLRGVLAAPSILIGHSLGGAAVISAASRIPEVRAVATIGAPADVAHVLAHISPRLGEIEERGAADVTLGGRTFKIRREFVEDARAAGLLGKVAALGRALLVMHAPRDEVVGIENAARIFVAARHPKSFVSLDDADHLLTRRRDATYCARVIAAWAERYVAVDGAHDGGKEQAAMGALGVGPGGMENRDELAALGPASDGPPPAGVVRIEETGVGRFQQRVSSGSHILFADEPLDVGGDDSGPGPYDLLAAALGACTSMTLRMYGARKGLSLTRVRVDVSHGKVHAEDCSDCGEGRVGRIDCFERRIKVEGDLTGEQRARLLEIADLCPVHKTLELSSVIVTRLDEA